VQTRKQADPIRAGQYRNGPGQHARPACDAGFRYPTKEVHMLRKFLFLVPVVALLALPAASQAQFEAGNWTLELSGSGSNDQDFDGGEAGVDGELGYMVSKEVQVGIRQGANWSDFGGSNWNGDTRAFGDYHFDMDRWQPYVGGFIGFVYGDFTDDTWIAGPEVGVKYFVNATTYIDVSAAYAFNLEESIDEGSYIYGLGLGFRW